MKTYDVPWRPNYEAYQTLAWGGGAASALALAQLADLPPGPMLAMASMSALVTVYRGQQAVRRYLAKRRLGMKRVSYIKRNWLVKHVKKRPNHTWMGWGFDYGSEQAQTAYDFLRAGMADRVEKLSGGSDPHSAGAFWIHGVGCEEKLDIPTSFYDGHSLIVGTTGAGKTRMFDILVTQAVLRGEPVFIIDPKGDKGLMETAKRACELAGEPERFVYFHPAHAEKSARIDPLRNWNRPTEIASRISALQPSEGASDPFQAFSWKALNDIVQGLLFIESRPNLISLRQYVEGGVDYLLATALRKYLDEHDEGWENHFRDVLKKAKDRNGEVGALIQVYRQRTAGTNPPVPPSVEIGGLISSYEHNREHFQKMVASLIPILSMLTSGSLGDLLSPRPIPGDERITTDTARIINNRQVAYIGLDSLADATVGSAIGSILMADLTAVAGDRYNYGVADLPVNVFIDEAAEVVNDPTVQLLNKGRGSKFRLFIATQTFADFVARMGSEAKARQVLGNVNNLVVLRTVDGATQKYIEEQMPEVAIRSLDIGYRSGSNTGSPIDFSGMYQEALKESPEPLIPASLLGRLPNFHYIAKFVGGRVVKGRIPIIT